MNLEQAQFEIEALQRRLAEYAGENQRLQAQCAAMREALEDLNIKLIKTPSAYLFPAQVSEHIAQISKDVSKALAATGKPITPEELGDKR